MDIGLRRDKHYSLKSKSKIIEYAYLNFIIEFVIKRMECTTNPYSSAASQNPKTNFVLKRTNLFLCLIFSVDAELKNSKNLKTTECKRKSNNEMKLCGDVLPAARNAFLFNQRQHKKIY